MLRGKDEDFDLAEQLMMVDDKTIAEAQAFGVGVEDKARPANVAFAAGDPSELLPSLGSTTVCNDPAYTRQLAFVREARTPAELTRAVAWMPRRYAATVEVVRAVNAHLLAFGHAGTWDPVDVVQVAQLTAGLFLDIGHTHEAIAVMVEPSINRAIAAVFKAAQEEANALCAGRALDPTEEQTGFEPSPAFVVLAGLNSIRQRVKELVLPDFPELSYVQLPPHGWSVPAFGENA